MYLAITCAYFIGSLLSTVVYFLFHLILHQFIFFVYLLFVISIVYIVVSRYQFLTFLCK